MELAVGAADPEESAAVRDFYRWLRSEDEPPGGLRLTARPVPGSMSGGLDVVNVVLTHTLGLANFALMYAGWRRARRSRAALTFTRASDGLTVTVEDGSPETVERLVAMLSAPAPAPAPPSVPGSARSQPPTGGADGPAAGVA